MSDDLQRHTLFLRKGDFALIQSYFPKQGASAVVRKLVSNFVDTRLDRPVTEQDLSDE
jgi:hypothetical protein